MIRPGPVLLIAAALSGGCATIDTPGSAPAPEIAIAQAVDIERRHLDALPQAQRWAPLTPPAERSVPNLMHGLAPGLLPKPVAGLRIELVAPRSEAEPVKLPARLRIQFNPSDGARIEPRTFRALYGLLKIDITGQLIRAGELLEQGLATDAALFPAGMHRLFVQVSDNQGAKVEREIRFSIAP